MKSRRALLASSAALAAMLTSCGGGHESASPAWTRLHWASASPPAPAGRHPIVQAAVWCDDLWYAAGATAGARDDTAPAVWTSADAVSWRPVRLHPGADYYAARAILTSVACSNGRVAALGAKSGGAHGNPRVATWRELPDGSLAAVPAPSEQYAGQDTVSVSRMSGGSTDQGDQGDQGGGFLVAGTRVGGAAVWSSPTGARFALHDNAPGLATTSAASTLALDAAWWQGSWTVVGDATLTSGRLVATAWSGAGDGPWTRVSLPGGTVVTTAERVTLTDAGPVVAGTEDRTFALWSQHDGRWSQLSTFGHANTGGTEPEFVSGLAAAGGLLVATYSDGASFRLAIGPATSLSDVPLPVVVSNRGDHTVTVATHGSDVLLLTDGGPLSRVWLTHLHL